MLLPLEKSLNLMHLIGLDDGTITRLDSKNVTWSTQNQNVSIQNGFLTAKQVSKNTRVSIEATAEGFKAILFVRILKDQSNAQDAEDLVDTAKNALSDSIDLEQPGWKNQIGSVIIMMVETTGYTINIMAGCILFPTVLTLHGYGHHHRNGSGPVHQYILTCTEIRTVHGCTSLFKLYPKKFIIINQANRLRGESNSKMFGIF